MESVQHEFQWPVQWLESNPVLKDWHALGSPEPLKNCHSGEKIQIVSFLWEIDFFFFFSFCLLREARIELNHPHLNTLYLSKYFIYLSVFNLAFFQGFQFVQKIRSVFLRTKSLISPQAVILNHIDIFPQWHVSWDECCL